MNRTETSLATLDGVQTSAGMCSTCPPHLPASPGPAATNTYSRFSAIGLYVDLDDRAVDVEIKILSDFLDKTSTNVLDRARREGRTVI